MARKKPAAFRTIEIHRNAGLAVLWLNRPEVKNALDGAMVEELTRAFTMLDTDDAARAVVIAARGDAFCAGADLRWMEKVAKFTAAENAADAERMVGMLATLAAMTKPTIVRVHGPVVAGGMGLVAAADIAVAAHGATFAFSEVKLGLVPASFVPYVIEAIGSRAARRYFITGERFDASEAYRLGLVQELATADELDATINEMLGALLLTSATAVASTKEMLREVTGQPMTPRLRAATAKWLAAGRASKDGKEGIRAVIAKRSPAWVPKE